MYGGSGTCPSASTAALDRRRACRRQTHEPPAVHRRSRISTAIARPARVWRLHAHARARLELLAGMDQRLPPPRRRCVRAPAALAAPPLGSRRPISRAGNTRVSLTTSRSPARGSPADPRSTLRDTACAARSTTISRDAARPRPGRSAPAADRNRNPETCTATFHHEAWFDTCRRKKAEGRSQNEEGRSEERTGACQRFGFLKS